MDEAQDEPLWTVREVARALRVDGTTVRRWISAGVLDAILLPGKGKRPAYRIRHSTMEAMMKTGESKRRTA